MLSIIIPVYNEVTTIAEVIKRVSVLPLDKQIIIVDDYSSDGTRDVLRNLGTKGIIILYHDQNMGKGMAIRTGLKVVEGEIVVIQDADLEYRPEELPGLVKMIEVGEAEVVYGSRFLGEHERKYLNILYVGNRFLSLFTALLYGRAVSDMETCYKVFLTRVIKGFKLHSKRFDFEPEVTANVLKGGFKFKEVPISYKGRSYMEGKKIGWKDGLFAIWTLLKYRFGD
jgi:glycosyltransferase involved in cell wall biosynthesis